MKFSKFSSELWTRNNQHAFQLLYYSSHLFGLWPFTITFHSNGSIEGVRVRLYDCFRFFTVICLHLTPLHNVYVEAKSINVRYKGGFFRYFIYFLNYIPTIAFGIVSIVINMLNRKRLVNVLMNFNKFDTEVRLFPSNRLNTFEPIL